MKSSNTPNATHSKQKSPRSAARSNGMVAEEEVDKKRSSEGHVKAAVVLNKRESLRLKPAALPFDVGDEGTDLTIDQWSRVDAHARVPNLEVQGTRQPAHGQESSTARGAGRDQKRKAGKSVATSTEGTGDLLKQSS